MHSFTKLLVGYGFFLLMLLFGHSTFSQGAFNKLFSESGADAGYSIFQTADNGYGITGRSSSFWEGSAQAFLLKIDSLGNKQWSRHYGGNESDWGQKILYRSGYGYIIAGFTNSISLGGYDMYLIHINEMGDVVWEKTYGGNGWDKINDGILLDDNSAIFVGSFSNGGNNEDFIVLKTSSNGDSLWSNNYGGIGSDVGTCISRITDSTIALGGYYYNEDSLKTKGLLMSLNNNGTLLWVDTIGANGDYKIKDLCSINNTIYCVGNNNRNNGTVDSWYYKCDLSGNIIYQHVYPGPSGDESFDLICPNGDSSFIYVVTTYENAWSSPNGSDLNIARNSLNFNPAVNFLIPFENEDTPGDIIPTSDGGIAFVGTSSLFTSGEINVVKIGPNDSLPSLATITEPLVSINETLSYIPLQVYPNPTRGVIYLKTGEIQITSVVIKNALGEVIKILRDSNGIENCQINELSSGFYFVEFYADQILYDHQSILLTH